MSTRYDPEVEALLRGDEPGKAPVQQVPATGKRRLPVPLPLIAGAVALALLAVFIMQNRHQTEVTFFLWSVGVSLIWALLVSSVLGAVLGFAAAWRMRRAPRRQK